ncbi:amidohydrolase [Harryflintia acetispora]|uniref:amidohydrolase n=1 Tax=Harryflintia acetispora TaxID=1849041 RepID=UPI001899B6BA|nr:amidohydrolase [Harryflintia acetispora]
MEQDRVYVSPRPLPGPPGPADDIWFGGTIYTIDQENRTAGALAVKGGRIAAVGGEEEVFALRGEGTRLHDLCGHTVLPGMIDTHTHAPGVLEKKMFTIFMGDAETKEEAVAAARDFIEAHPGMDRYFGFGYSNKIAGDWRGPKKEWLDEVCKDKPIVIQAMEGHSWWVNSKGFSLFGVERDTVPASGVIHHDEDGELWGTICDIQGVEIPRPRFSEEQDMIALRAYQEQMHRFGYTGMMSMSGQITPNPVAAMHELDGRGELKMRVSASLTVYPEREIGEQLDYIARKREEYRSERLDLRVAKFFGDGTTGGGTAYLSEPYSNAAPGEEAQCGYFLWEREKLAAAFLGALRRGLQIHIHSIGDESTSVALDCIGQAQREAGEGDWRTGVAHLDVTKPRDIPRLAALHCTAAVQTFWHFKEPGVWEEELLPMLGPERAERVYPLRSLFEAGIVVTNSSDEPSTVDPNPFQAIEAGVTRNLYSPEKYGVEPITDADDPKWLLGPDERVSVLEMVRSYTINAAYAMFKEDMLGSLEVGKYADFLELSQDIFHCDPLMIERTRVLRTVFDGEIVYESK